MNLTISYKLFEIGLPMLALNGCLSTLGTDFFSQYIPCNIGFG